jgi:long-chain acyl-CoA synthetase
MSLNIATMLRESATANPDKPLCHINDLTFTYAQVDEISGRVGAALLATGLKRGDKVALQLPNLPQFLFTYFGLMKAGLVMVPLNPLLRAPEVATTCRTARRRCSSPSRCSPRRRSRAPASSRASRRTS